MSKSYWMVKSEPESYSWKTFCADGKTAWTGVRSYPARLALRAMKEGDRVLFYHSVSDKEVVGIAKVIKTAYADPTAEGEDWSAVDLAPVGPLKTPVTLATIKGDKSLAEMQLLKQSRLSVLPVTKAEYERIASHHGGVRNA